MNFDAERYAALRIHWETLVREVIGGHHLASISRLGSAGTFVRAQIGSFGTKEKDESAVRAALDSVLLDSPIASVPSEGRPRAILSIIELVGELKPERGGDFLATLLLADDESLSPGEYSHASHLRPRDLRKLALVTLGDYYAIPIFSAPGSPRTAAFCTYVEILNRHLIYPGCTVEAALQLLRINHIQLDDAWPLKLDLSAIQELVPRANDLKLVEALEVMADILVVGRSDTYGALFEAYQESFANAFNLHGGVKTLWSRS